MHQCNIMFYQVMLISCGEYHSLRKTISYYQILLSGGCHNSFGFRIQCSLFECLFSNTHGRYIIKQILPLPYHFHHAIKMISLELL